MKEQLDMPLSQHVAKEASQQINKLDKELNENKDSFIFFLKDVINDNKQHVKVKNKVICFLCGLVLILILALVGLSIYFINLSNKQAKESTKQFMEFLNESEFYYEVELMNENSDYNFNNLISK